MSAPPIDPIRDRYVAASRQADALERRAGRRGAVALWTLVVALSAVAAHALAILAMPRVAPDDAFARLSALAPRAVPTPLPPSRPGQEIAPFADPAALLAFCRYDLADGPLRVHAEVDGENYLSLSFRSRWNASYYALTDRAAQKGALDALVVTQDQLDAIEAGEEAGETVGAQSRVVSPTREGFVLMRALAPTPFEAEAAAQRLRAVRCDVVSLAESAEKPDQTQESGLRPDQETQQEDEPQAAAKMPQGAAAQERPGAAAQERPGAAARTPQGAAPPRR
jgi:uncharacterized membrane protein